MANATVCKTVIHWFDSCLRLQNLGMAVFVGPVLGGRADRIFWTRVTVCYRRGSVAVGSSDGSMASDSGGKAN